MSLVSKKKQILVIDGQGGGMGRQLTAALKEACPQAEITAVGTNSMATFTNSKLQTLFNSNW